MIPTNMQPRAHESIAHSGWIMDLAAWLVSTMDSHTDIQSVLFCSRVIDLQTSWCILWCEDQGV